MALTRRQREIYDFVRGFVGERGYSPSLEEIGAQFGLSSVAPVHKHVQHLVEKGLLKKAWNRSRSVEPVAPEGEKPAGVVTVLLAGVVAAGAPIEASEDAETLDVPRDLVPPRAESFALQVRGDSMIEDQIRDGDYVVVERRSEARNGETTRQALRHRHPPPAPAHGRHCHGTHGHRHRPDRAERCEAAEAVEGHRGCRGGMTRTVTTDCVGSNRVPPKSGRREQVEEHGAEI